jgi:exopolysaccharide biosynthesis polyprenyl glycosylphosphotransferase
MLVTAAKNDNGRAWLAPAPLPDDLPTSRTAWRIGLVLAGVSLDLAAIFVSYALGSWLGFTIVPKHSLTLTWLAITSIYVAVAINNGAFRPEALLHPKRGTPRAAWALLCAVGAMLLAAFFLRVSTTFSRLTFGLGTCVALGALPFIRHLVARVAWSVMDGRLISTLVIRDRVEFSAREGEYVLDAEHYGLVPNRDNPVVMDRLGQLFGRIDRVVVACREEDRPDWAMTVQGMDANVEILVPELAALSPLAIGKLGETMTAQVACTSLSLTDRAIKRAFDLSLTLMALPLLAPLLLATIIAIKLDSPGPIFFKQKRIGQGNRLFSVYKFRSMRVEASDKNGSRSAARDDDRVTRVGRFIRSTSIDELPQLFNVLNGTMSLVGPRPHAAASTAEDKYFWTIDQRYWDRHAMKPGLTGLAQVRGYRGATHCRSDFTNRLHADLEYLSKWTLWTDIRILLSTARVVVHRNAF